MSVEGRSTIQEVRAFAVSSVSFSVVPPSRWFSGRFLHGASGSVGEEEQGLPGVPAVSASRLSERGPIGKHPTLHRAARSFFVQNLEKVTGVILQLLFLSVYQSARAVSSIWRVTGFPSICTCTPKFHFVTCI